MKQRAVWGIIVLTGALLLHGCAAPEPTQDLLAPTEAQMKIRSVQTRTFDVKDRQLAMRGVIAALQDLGFIIERANEPLGLVTAARFAEPELLRRRRCHRHRAPAGSGSHDDPGQRHLQQQAGRRPQGVSELLRHPRTVALHHQGVRPVGRLVPNGDRQVHPVTVSRNLLGIGLCLLLQGCPTPYEWRHQDQWDSREQIWLSEQSQVKLRAAQSRVFDTTDRHGRSKPSSTPCRTWGSWWKCWTRTWASSQVRSSNPSKGPGSGRIPSTTSTTIKAS